MQRVCIEMMNEKDIYLDLFEEYAPLTVANFLHLVDIGFYNNVVFHRVIGGFMAQTGGYAIDNGGLVERHPGYSIPGEFPNNGWANRIKHTPGIVSMARTEDMNSAGAQFFICDLSENGVSFLDGNYAAFGITADEDSLEFVHEICSKERSVINAQLTDFPNAPLEDITIKTIRRVNV